MTCLIIGCALYLQHSDAYAWGDLHLCGDRYVFNGTTTRDGLMHWCGMKPPEPIRALVIPVGEDYFERRGVLICRASRDLLNETAREYIGLTPID